MSVEAGQPRTEVRRCRALFILGSGFSPSESAEALAQEFRNGTEGLDFSKCRSVVAKARPWSDGDRSGLESSVHRTAEAWCRKHKIEFDAQKLLIRDYKDGAGQQYAVAAYLPPTKTKPQPETAPEPAITKTVTPQPEPEPEEEVFAEAVPVATIDDVPDQPLSPDEIPTFQAAAPTKKELGAIGRMTAKIDAAANLPLDWLGKQSPKARKLILAGAGVAVLAILAAVIIPFLPKSDETPEGTDVAGTDGADDGPADLTALPPVQFPTGLLRIYTPDEGFHVLIDGEPVRDAEGNLATTPMAVTAQSGNPTVTVFREGWFDVSAVAEISEDGEIEVTPQQDLFDGGGSAAMQAPLMNAEVGVPVAMEAVNSNRPEFDPYVTPDGLALWFAADRAEGRGIFVATRQSVLHQFDPPEVAFRESDLPGSPSTTDDGLLVVYAFPEKARLAARIRNNPLEEFQDRKMLKGSTSFAPTWTAAQMLGDGLRMYWTERAEDEMRTLTLKRDDKLDDFGKMSQFAMPGVYPCLSRDGLRQYVFKDGKVTRYRRTSVTTKFLEDKVIGELELENYKPSPRHRQYFISNDEQWMYYCDDPQNGGDFYIVRLSNGPQWGVVPRGKSIPPKAAVVMVEDPDPDAMPDENEEPEEKPIDPRSLPLPYTSFRDSFVSLMGIRNYEAAEGLLRNAKVNPAMGPFAEQLKWDEADLQSVRDFWSKLEEALMQVKRNDEFRLGTLKLQFTEYDQGIIRGLRGTTRVERNLYELAPTDMTGLFDAVADKEDAEAQHLFAVFLQYTADESSAIDRLRQQRIERAGENSVDFAEKLGRRKLVQAQAEFDRDNFGKGVGFLKEVLAMGRSTPVAAEAAEMEASLYTFLKWNASGPRQWQQDGNAYTATLERANGAMLVSGNQYHNFEVSLEWMTVNARTAQGGIYFRYPGTGNVLDYAYKLHLANDAGVPADQYTTGSLLGESAPDSNEAKPAGQWNTLLLRVIDDQMTVRINGRKVLETQLVSETVPDRGHVCLDGAAGGITYRKILVTDLPD